MFPLPRLRRGRIGDAERPERWCGKRSGAAAQKETASQFHGNAPARYALPMQSRAIMSVFRSATSGGI
jgi:hypothetical protein